jgi:hypothetical protein
MRSRFSRSSDSAEHSDSIIKIGFGLGSRTQTVEKVADLMPERPPQWRGSAPQAPFHPVPEIEQCADRSGCGVDPFGAHVNAH